MDESGLPWWSYYYDSVFYRQIIIIVLLVGFLLFIQAFLVSALTALLHSYPTRLKSDGYSNRKGYNSAVWLLDHLGISTATLEFLVAISIFVFAFTLYPLAKCLDNLLIPANIECRYCLLSFEVLVLVLAAAIQATFIGLCTRFVALKDPEAWLCNVSFIIHLIVQALYPIACLLLWMSNRILTLFNSPIVKLDRFHSLSDLSMIVSQSTESGVLDKEEEQMLKGVFGFSETIAREVMTPRTDLVAIDINASFEEVLKIVKQSGLSRFPVRGEKIDDIVGVVLAKDLFACIPDQGLQEKGSFHVRDIMREAYFVPGTKPIDDLLNEFKHRKHHIAVVLDEHGGVDGVVTLEDLIEEIVGDIFDESDESEQNVTELDNGEILVDGGMLVADVNDLYGLSIPEGDYDTIAGFVFSSVGRMTQVGDTVVVHYSGEVEVNLNVTDVQEAEEKSTLISDSEDTKDYLNEESYQVIITVESLDNNRIETLRLKLNKKDYNSESFLVSSES